jgi:hypothetical protein
MRYQGLSLKNNLFIMHGNNSYGSAPYSGKLTNSLIATNSAIATLILRTIHERIILCTMTQRTTLHTKLDEGIRALQRAQDLAARCGGVPADSLWIVDLQSSDFFEIAKKTPEP